MKPAKTTEPGGPARTCRTADPEIAASERYPRAAAHLTRKLGDDPELLLAGLASASSTDFLAWLVAYLQSSLDVAFAFVGEFRGNEWQQIRTVALHTTDGPQADLQYELRGTPCSNVVGAESCCYLKDVAAQFPEDKQLQDLGMESYLGVPLFDPSHRPLGIMVLMDTQAMPGQKAQLAEETMGLFRARTEKILANRRNVREFAHLAESSSALIEHGQMGSLAAELAHVMHVKVAFISKLATTRSLRTLGLCIDGQIQDDIEYDISGTPCEHVYSEPTFLITQGGT